MAASLAVLLSVAPAATADDLADARGPSVLMSIDQRDAKELEAFRAGSLLNPHARLAQMTSGLHFPAFSMLVHDPAEDKYNSRALLKSGRYERPLVDVVLNALAAAGGREAFLDIGVNLGVYTLSALAGGYRSVGFEAMAYNAELVAASAARMRAESRLSLFKTAVTDTAARAQLCIASGAGGATNRGNGQLKRMDVCNGGAGSTIVHEIVPAMSVDAAMHITADPTLNATCFAAAKIDVEGSEARALRGARRIMTGACPPCDVIVEQKYGPVHDGANARRHERPVALLHSFGYTCRRAGGDHFHCLLNDATRRGAARCLARFDKQRTQ